MSLHTVVLTSGRPKLDPTTGEEYLVPFQGFPADIELRIPPTVHGPKRTEKQKGRVWVTDHRIVFVADPKGQQGQQGQQWTLEVPHTCLLTSTFHLPTFSPNQILITFLPSPSPPSPTHTSQSPPGEVLPHPGRGAHLEIKLVVGDGAGHGVWKHVEGQRVRWEEMRLEGEQLPAYGAGGPSGASAASSASSAGPGPASYGGASSTPTGEQRMKAEILAAPPHPVSASRGGSGSGSGWDAPPPPPPPPPASTSSHPDGLPGYDDTSARPPPPEKQ